MRYWEEDPSMGGHNVITTKKITKENVMNTLKYIKGGYLPDWNHESHADPGTGEEVSLPNEYYPLHIAMQAALKAVETMDDSFFEEMEMQNQKYLGQGGDEDD